MQTRPAIGLQVATALLAALPVAAIARAHSDAPLRVTAATLYAEYRENEVAADKKYEGKALSVSGEVLSLNENNARAYPEVILRASPDSSRRGVSVYFQMDAAAALARLRVGQHVVFLCQSGGMGNRSPRLFCLGPNLWPPLRYK